MTSDNLTRTAAVLALLVVVVMPLATARAAGASRDAASMSVSPSHGLHTGEQVTVRVRGFPSGEKVFLSECATASEANPEGCGEELAAQVIGFTNGRGNGTVQFTARPRAAVGPITRTHKPRHEACAECFLVATDGEIADRPRFERVAVAPLFFGAQALPFTGLSAADLGAIGALSLGVGAVLTAASRRRRSVCHALGTVRA